jgi:CheY-like chemotaxis protein
MNGVIGMTGLLLDADLTGELREYAETIRGSADSLLGMIDSILDLSRVEAGGMTLESSAFDLVECLRGIGDLMAPRAEAKAVSYRFDSDVPCRPVYGDSGRLRQIVLSLLENAVKFTDRGAIELRLRSAGTDSGRAVYEISVRDTGVGIPREKLPLLFSKFAQGDSSLARKYGGSGVGLAVSRQLAHLMGGNITVTSECGRGSDFTLKVPLEACPDAESGPPPALCARARHMLLAEDNPVNQKIGQRLLEKLGCRVDVAGNGREAVEMAERFTYDLILMDCRMPEMDGFEACRHIRSRPPDKARVPIVALTAHNVAGVREECLDAGMDDYLSKPVRLGDLERVLLRWSP